METLLTRIRLIVEQLVIKHNKKDGGDPFIYGKIKAYVRVMEFMDGKTRQVELLVGEKVAIYRLGYNPNNERI